ncbi:PQ loop repeat-domain-containing protein [Sporodiniella umbellata]|nr:PQ loop repeat-domain-containing protein [Sporodiniella umbellata]
MGYCSIAFWLNAQLPQVIENYRKSSADGLSLNFLCIWLAGDTTNLIGTLLTDQLPFQSYLGFYFVTVDICLLLQWFYYNRFRASQDEYLIIPQQEDTFKNYPPNSLFQHPVPLNIQSTPILDDESAPFSSSASPSKWYTLSAKDGNPVKLMALLLFFLNPSASAHEASGLVWIGRLSAWTCTCLYLMSRIPQLLKNRRRQSVQGLSASLFMCAACANLTYTLSILTHPNQTLESLLEALPYLIGSSGTLVFDFLIFSQFLYYRNSPPTHPV